MGGVMDEGRMIGAILAGLRLLQCRGTPLMQSHEHNYWIEQIATDGGIYPLPTEQEIDDLCEELNCGAVSLTVEEPTQ